MKSFIEKHKVNLLFFFILLAMIGCTAVNKYFGIPDDHFVEELTEEVIKANTGLDLDLTPQSPEK